MGYIEKTDRSRSDLDQPFSGVKQTTSARKCKKAVVDTCVGNWHQSLLMQKKPNTNNVEQKYNKQTNVLWLPAFTTFKTEQEKALKMTVIISCYKEDSELSCQSSAAVASGKSSSFNCPVARQSFVYSQIQKAIICRFLMSDAVLLRQYSFPIS